MEVGACLTIIPSPLLRDGKFRVDTNAQAECCDDKESDGYTQDDGHSGGGMLEIRHYARRGCCERYYLQSFGWYAVQSLDTGS